MTTPADIQGYIAQGLPCDHLSVDGDGAHFEALIVSAAFEGLNRIQRQQAVYKALGGRIESGEIHALSMRTLTPQEWEAQRG
jgi:acid stress-induced BolA-like protein IbaG/YrbA